MTQDEIIEMAKQSDLGFLLGDSWLMHHEIESFAKLVAEKEREACAKLCEEMSNTQANMNAAWRNGCRDAATEIRARGTSMTAAYFEDHPTDPDKVILRKPRHEDDDDIQEYKKPWVGLTDDEIADCAEKMEASDPTDSFWREFFRGIEAKLKEKNT